MRLVDVDCPASAAKTCRIIRSVEKNIISGTNEYNIYLILISASLDGVTSSFKDTAMVSAVSSSASTLLSSSSSSSDLASLEAQLSEKKAALEKTDDKDEKATIEKAIATLEAKIAKLSASGESAAAQSSGTDNAKQATASSRLSGEAERIGEKNFDEKTEFGDRTAYV